MALPGIKIHKAEKKLLLKRVPSLCMTQFSLDCAGLLFIFSLVYFSAFSMPLLFLGAAIFLLFFLRRAVHAWIGKVTLSDEGLSWRNTTLGGITWNCRLPWNEIEKLETVHENPHPRNRTTTGYFLQAITKSGKTHTLLRVVTGFENARNACLQLNALLATQQSCFKR